MITRRQFLRMLVQSSVLVGCAETPVVDEMPLKQGGAPAPTTEAPLADSAPVSVDVVVVGAGIAGVAAARAISDAGYRVHIVEARDRVGGRIWSWSEWGAPVELGANWIHTADGNPITKLAKQADVATRPDPEEGEEVMIDLGAGRRLSESELERLYDTFDAILDDIYDEAADRADDESIADAIAAHPKYQRLDADKQRLLDAVIVQVVNDEYAVEPAQLSWKYFNHGEEAYDGDDRFVVGGYDRIPAMLADGVPIALNTVVERVQWNADGVTVWAGAQSWQARTAVITVPLGVLQAGDIVFEPALGDAYTWSINALAMGTLDRCVLQFDQVFWDEDLTTISVVGDDPQRWYQFIPLNNALGIPALAGFNAGAAAEELEELTDEAVIAEMVAVLQQAFETSEFAVVDAKITRWKTDPFARGAYSYVPVGGDFTARQVLSEPMHNVIVFAGEACTTSDPATVHGAYNSGRDAAAWCLEVLDA